MAGRTALQTIIEDDNEFQEYYKMAQGDVPKVLALVARQSDRTNSQLSAHCKAPISEAHPTANNTPTDEDVITYKGKASKIFDYMFKLIAVIAVIAMGGAGLKSMFPSIGLIISFIPIIPIIIGAYYQTTTSDLRMACGLLKTDTSLDDQILLAQGQAYNYINNELGRYTSVPLTSAPDVIKDIETQITAGLFEEFQVQVAKGKSTPSNKRILGEQNLKKFVETTYLRDKDNPEYWIRHNKDYYSKMKIDAGDDEVEYDGE